MDYTNTATQITSVKKPAATNNQKKTKKSGKTPIVINPKISDQLNVNERVIGLMQRLRRGSQMRRRESMLKLKRSIARMRPHSKKQLAQKANVMAKNIVRARFAGARGSSYQHLGRSDKVQVDRQIDPKVHLVRRIAARLMPRLRQADVRRLAHATGGKATKGIRSYMGNTPLMASMSYKDAEQLQENLLLIQMIAEKVAKRLKGEDPCWDGYHMVGTKKKGSKEVPNCVPEETDIIDTADFKLNARGRKVREKRIEFKVEEVHPQIGDAVDIELGDTVFETSIADIVEDGVVLEIDQTTFDALIEAQAELVEDSDIKEAEYQGRDVPLGKPMAGDVKKSKVFVKGPSGRVVKVNFGDKNMTIKKNIPARRKSFRARHNCDNPGPRHKARYWSCRAW